MSAHHNADAYLEASGISDDKKGLLFRSLDRRRRLTEGEVAHTFRATGITTYLENGGTIENAQQIAANESPRSKLHGCTSDVVSLDDMEPITI